MSDGPHRPSLSIITATRNAASELSRTLASLQAQDCRDFEHVVVDGASTDGTRDILGQSGSGMTRWVSEPDAGISDAFNKGVRMANGRLLLFLGAGDRLADPGVVGRVLQFAATARTPCFFYGDVLYDYGTARRRVHRNYRWARFRRYSCIPHQAMFLDRWFFGKYGLFDTAIRRTMDYEHTARFIREHPPQYLPSIIAIMPRTGVSTDVLPTHDEMDVVRRRHRLATETEIRLSRHVLHLKILVQRTIFGRPW